MLPGDRDGLAGEAADDEVDGRGPFRIEGRNISMARNVGPVPRENPATKRIALDLPAAAPAGALEPEVEAANPGKKGSECGTSVIGAQSAGDP